ncbi:MAG: SDR family oxidoreductase [Bacteroidota bacterium]
MIRKSIFITGAGRGIGKATAKYFASKGWFIGLADISRKEIETLASELGPDQCSTHLLDVRNTDQVQQAIQEFSTRTGGQLNVLFNNAGIVLIGGFENVSLEQHKAVVDINFIGQMNVTHIALPLLKATPKSAIVTMCSASAIYGNPEITAYAATKSAVKSLTEGWNMLFQKYDIHVADLLPAYVKTDMVMDVQDEMKLADKNVKLSAEQIAQAVWKAAHSKKMHHYIGTDAKLFRWVKWIAPKSLFLAILKRGLYKEALRRHKK